MVDPVVTQLAIGLPWGDQELIGRNVLPPCEVEAEDFLVRVWGTEAREELSEEDAIIGPDGEAKRSTFSASMKKDHLEEWGREAKYGYRTKMASLRTKDKGAAYIDLDLQYVGGIKSQTALLQEKMASKVINNDDNIIPEALFDDVDFGNQNIDLYQIFMKAKEERQKNTAPLKVWQFGVQAWRLAKSHKSILGNLSANERKIVTKEIFASLLEVDDIEVGEAVAGIGVNARYLWPVDRCTLLYANKTALAGLADPSVSAANKLNPSFGYTYWCRHILTTPEGRQMLPDLAAATGVDGLGTNEVVYSYREGTGRVVGYRYFALPRVAFKDSAIAWKNVNPNNK
jgi:hypothetical protein